MANVKIQKRTRKNRNSWVVTFVDPVSGKSKYHGTYRTLEAAKSEKKELVELIDAGKVLKIRKKDTAMLTFAEVSKAIRESWQRRFANHELRKETVDGYLVHAKLLDAEFGKRRLCMITRDDIVAFRDRLARQHSNVLANRRLFVLKQIFKHGLLLNAIFEDPAASMSKLSEKEHERNRFLYQPELERLIACSQKTRARYYMPALIYLGAEHGASRQEALDLKWEDIAFDYGSQGFIYFKRTKNGRQRTMHLGILTRKALLNWRKHHEWMRHRKRIKAPDSDYVFCRLNGTRIKSFDSAWKASCTMAGIKNFHFHDLRHTYCSHIILNGGGLKEAKEMIGHEDIAMTDRYTHLPMAFQQQIVNRLSEYYAGSGNVVDGSDAIEDSNRVTSQRHTLGTQSGKTKKNKRFGQFANPLKLWTLFGRSERI